MYFHEQNLLCSWLRNVLRKWYPSHYHYNGSHYYSVSQCSTLQRIQVNIYTISGLFYNFIYEFKHVSGNIDEATLTVTSSSTTLMLIKRTVMCMPLYVVILHAWLLWHYNNHKQTRFNSSNYTNKTDNYYTLANIHIPQFDFHIATMRVPSGIYAMADKYVIRN